MGKLLGKPRPLDSRNRVTLPPQVLDVLQLKPDDEVFFRLDDGKITMALMGGALDSFGEFTIRVGYQPSMNYLIELSFSQANGRFGSLMLFGGELIIPIGPWRSIVPFVSAGGGGAAAWPHQQAQLFKSRTSFSAFAGGGVFVGLRGPCMVRLDIQRVLLFGPNQLDGLLLIQGGLMVTF